MSSSTLSDLSILAGLGLGNAVGGLSVAFTPATSRWRRIGLFLLQIATLYMTVRDLSHTNNVLATFAGGSVVIISLQYIEQVFLNKWSVEASGPTSTLGGLRPASIPAKAKAKGPDTFCKRLAFAGSMTLQHRYPNTNWPVKGIPAFDLQNSKTIPTRTAFLRRTALELVLLLLVLDVNAYLPQDPNHAVMFSNARIPLFRRWNEVSAEELATRFAGVTMFAFFGYAVIDAQYHFIALLHVASGLAQPADYPPLVGRLAQLYSLQQFWGTFWHQSFRRKLTSPAHFITFELLHLPRRNLVSHMVFISTTFFISGILHTLGDVVSGCPLEESGAMTFFCMQPLGLIFETLVVALYHFLLGKSNTKPPAWAKVVGVIYFLAWMTWTGPSYMWYTLRVSQPGLLRFSFLGHFLK